MNAMNLVAPACARVPKRSQRLGATGVLVMMAGVLVLLSGPASAARSIEDAVYTRAQARSGKQLYQEHCIACHERGYFRQVLRTRQGETLDPLFEVMVTQMPQNDPGSLSDAEYLELIAYMLSEARYADGKKKLKVGDLSEIHIPPSS
jgi:mono/diheme cytochrome c family protein